jgi:pyridinium-3,5-biscarboxylic acid mononucleotide sulfurtransferase
MMTMTINAETQSPAALDPALTEKYQSLVRRLKELGSVVVAYSGGVDSSLLAVVAHQALAPRMLAVTIRSQVETVGIMETAQSVAAQFGFPHQIIDYDKLQDDDYVENSPNRCYVCKSVDLGIIADIARKAGIQHVLMGANADDLGDYRPGLRAAKELGVLSPLAELGFTKKDVRALAKALGLGNWNHPSSPCLASRIPYGTHVTREKLEQIAAGEAYLRALNFNVVRVRNTGPLARIEVPTDEIERLIGLRETVTAYFKQIGFQYVTVDLEGFRSGSLNEVLKKRKS